MPLGVGFLRFRNLTGTAVAPGRVANPAAAERNLMDFPCCTHVVGAPVDRLCGWRAGVGRRWEGGAVRWSCPGIAAANDGFDHRFDLSHGEPRVTCGIQQGEALPNFCGGEALCEQGPNERLVGTRHRALDREDLNGCRQHPLELEQALGRTEQRYHKRTEAQHTAATPFLAEFAHDTLIWHCSKCGTVFLTDAGLKYRFGCRLSHV